VTYHSDTNGAGQRGKAHGRSTAPQTRGNVGRRRHRGQRSANCIETSLLYASAAEALDLEAALILIPGHAYVGVRTDQENANYYFSATTMIGHASFSEAVDFARGEFDDALPHISAGETGYGWVKIWDERADGILPLPWH
jgi:hypothetical protein